MPRSLFLDVFPALPPTAGTNHPHIVNVEAYNTNGVQNMIVKLPHAVVTMLHHIGTNTLTQFLDPKRPYFRLVQEWRDPKQTDKLVIAKQDDTITIGTYTEDDAKDQFAFGHLVRYAITKDGSWDMYYGSYRDYFWRDWDEVLAGKTKMKDGSPMAIWLGHDPDGDWDEFPKKLADVIMDGRAWDKALSEWTITDH